MYSLKGICFIKIKMKKGSGLVLNRMKLKTINKQINKVKHK